MKIPAKYNLRSLLVRRGTTLMTIGAIALVVLVFVGVLALAGGLEATFAASGDASNVVVLRQGALSETQSGLTLDQKSRLTALPGIAAGADGRPLASGQLVVVKAFKRADGGESNVMLRGVEPAMFALRPRVKITSGRTFEPGRGELIVGRGLARRYAALGLGREVTFGKGRFHVVGVFAAQGGSVESEVWGAATDVQAAFERPAFSAVLLRAASPAEALALAARIESDPSLRLKAVPEPKYYVDQTRYNALRFVLLGYLLAAVMSFGACFAAANTMYAQVASRAAEIGTLRAIGFGRGSILSAFLLEAALLGLLAGLLGVLLSLPLNALTSGTFNSVTFSETTFTLRTTPGILVMGLVLAVLTCVLGGFPAAWSAARRPVVALLRGG